MYGMTTCEKKFSPLILSFAAVLLLDANVLASENEGPVPACYSVEGGAQLAIGENLLTVTTHPLVEDEVLSVAIDDRSGKRLFEHSELLGRVFISARTERVFLASYSSHYIVDDSVIVDFSGSIQQAVKGPSASVLGGCSTDGLLFWLAGENFTDPVTYRLSAYGANGEQMTTAENLGEGGLIEINDRAYRFTSLTLERTRLE